MKAILLLLLSATAFAADRTVEKTFDVNPDATLLLDSHKGKITIRTHASDQIVVNARIYMPEYGTTKMSESDVADLIDAVEIRIADSPSQVAVDVDYKNTQSIFEAMMTKSRTNPAVDFDVFVPAGGNLKLESHKGSMDVDAPSGSIDIESHKGEGKISGVRGDLELETHKGNFTVDVEELHNIDIESHKGNVDLTIVGASDFSMAAASHKGKFNFSGRDIPIKRGKRHGLNAAYSEGNGANRINLETHKGNITINFED